MSCNFGLRISSNHANITYASFINLVPRGPFCHALEESGPIHSRPQSPRSFWPAAGIESSGRNRFSEHAQSICFIFSANQICQIWQEVCESRTAGVVQSQSSRSLPQVRRIMALGTRMGPIPVAVPRYYSVVTLVLRSSQRSEPTSACSVQSLLWYSPLCSE